MDARNTFTGRGILGLSPWIGTNDTYCIAQLYLGSNSMSKLEVVSTLNINNMGRSFLHYYDINRTNKYNPKVYIGAQNSVAEVWQQDFRNGHNFVLPTWPERFVIKI